MAKVFMLVKSTFKGAKSAQMLHLEKGDAIDEAEVTHLVKGEDYDTQAKAEEKQAGKKK